MLRAALRDLVDLVLPDVCPGCGAAAAPPACATCLGELRASPRRYAPDPCPDGLPAPWAVAAYDGPVRALVIAHKERGRLALARWLGAALARSALAAAGGPGAAIGLVPVPSTAAARRARGHDPTARMARYAAASLVAAGQPAAVGPALRHRRRVLDQAGLTSDARAANLAHAFAVNERRLIRVRGRIVVVDDVVTTGATLTEAVRALAARDQVVAGTAVVAATQRRRGFGQASGSP